MLHGDSREVLRTLPDCSVDAVVTDPPYGLGKPPDPRVVLAHWLAGDDVEVTGGGFMGRSWDSFVPGPPVWEECLRVLKPGGHLLAFFGTRTLDMGGLAIRLAGFEIRDSLAWLYGSGFPKSLDVGKAIDKAAGAERPVTGTHKNWGATHQWDGWGTALKPAFEPVVVARKPLVGTVAQNVLGYGVGGLNIDGCRVGDSGGLGRWPANVILDDDAAALLDRETPGKEPSRFFYTAKASKKERRGSKHPTVKPIELMRYLVRLVTPPGGLVLDPFAGSGTTLEAAVLEGFSCIGVEREAGYIEDINTRLGITIETQAADTYVRDLT